MDQRYRLGPALGLAVAVPVALAVYARALGVGFLSDDFVHVARILAAGPFGLWSGGGEFLRPLVSLSLALDLAVWGPSPVPFHLHNVLVHALNGVLVGLLAASLARRVGGAAAGGDPPRRIGWLAGGLFLVAPCHAESVTWISGRTDLYAALFVLLALLTWAAHLDRPRLWLAALSAAAYGLALASKESAIVTPALLVVLRPGRRPEGPTGLDGLLVAVRTAWPHLALTVVYLAVRLLVLDHPWRGPLSAAPEAARSARLAAVHLVKLAGAEWPARLAATHWPVRDEPWLVALLTVIPLAVLGVAMWLGLRRRPDVRPVVAVAAVSAGLALLPVLHLPTRLLTTESDRFLYLPSAFAAVGMAAVLTSLARTARAWRMASCGALVVGAALLWWANGAWQHAGELARAVVAAAAEVAGEHELLIAAVPDNIRGAYILRHGLGEALTLERRERLPGPAVRVLTSFDLHHPSSGLVIEAHGRGHLLALEDSHAAFHLKEPPPACLVLEARGPDRLLLEGRCPTPVRAWLSQAAGLATLDRAPPPTPRWTPAEESGL